MLEVGSASKRMHKQFRVESGEASISKEGSAQYGQSFIETEKQEHMDSVFKEDK